MELSSLVARYAALKKGIVALLLSARGLKTQIHCTACEQLLLLLLKALT